MQNLIAHDLRTGRKKTGLTQSDVAVLLGISRQEVVALESGQQPPTLLHLCKLAVVYKRSFADYYEHLVTRARHELFAVLPNMPECTVDGLRAHNRERTLARLEETLTAAITKRHD